MAHLAMEAEYMDPSYWPETPAMHRWAENLESNLAAITQKLLQQEPEDTETEAESVGPSTGEGQRELFRSSVKRRRKAGESSAGGWGFPCASFPYTTSVCLEINTRKDA